jgi:phosphatidate cytidylyltransferase
MAGSFVPLPTLDIVASLGGALAVAGFAYRLVGPGTGAGAPRGGAALRAAATFAAAVGAAGAFWLGGDALVALFAVVSILALADFVAQDAAGEGSLQAACCYACVPLQFGALAAGRLDLALALLPLVLTLAMPLLMLVHGGSRHLVERAGARAWAVMAWVYCLSHVPALLLLDGPAFEDRNTGLVAFVVAVALAAQAMRSWGGAVSHPRIWLVRAIALTAVGAALAWMTPFAMPVAAVLALATAIAGWVGAFVLATVRRERATRTGTAGALARIAPRPDGLVFAAPVFFYAVRAVLAW